MEAVLLDVHKHGRGNTGCQVTSEPDHSRLRSPLEYTTAGDPGATAIETTPSIEPKRRRLPSGDHCSPNTPKPGGIGRSMRSEPSVPMIASAAASGIHAAGTPTFVRRRV